MSEFPQIRWVGGIPHPGAQWKNKTALQSTSAGRAASSAALTHTHACLGTGFPQHRALKWDGPHLPAQCHVNCMGAPWCTHGFSCQTRAFRDLIPADNCFAGLFLLRYASRQASLLKSVLKPVLQLNVTNWKLHVPSKKCLRKLCMATRWLHFK